MAKFLLSFLYLFMIALSIDGQSTSFSFDHLTVDDGLSYSTVHDILQDDLGMIWIGTRFGLNRFDGYEFKTFLPDPKDPYAIRSQSILCLHLDALGNIWIGHLNGGVSVLEKKTGRFLRFPFSKNNTLDWDNITIRSIFQDPSGNTWLGTYGAGTVVFDSTYHEIAHFCTTCTTANRQLNNDFVFDFFADPEGKIWIGTAGRGIHVFDWRTNILQVVHSDDPADMDGFAKSICMGPEGTIWVGTEGNGLYEIDRKKLSVIQKFDQAVEGAPGLSHRMITDVIVDEEGHLWIATDGGGLNRYTPSTNEWQHFTYQPDFPNSLNSDALYDLMFDATGNLWIGTFNGGINLHKSVFPPFVMDRQYAHESAEGLRSVLCIDQDKDENVWLGTDGGGLFKLDVHQKPIKLYSIEKSALHPPGIKVITSLVTRSDGDIWFGTFAQGLFLFNEERGVIEQFQHDPNDPSSLSHNNVWDLEQDEDGGLWIGTLGGGVCYLKNGEKKFERYLPDANQPNHISGTQVIDILLDKKRKQLWVATENSGLSKIDLNSFPYHISNYHHHPKDTLSLNSENLRCLKLDNEGTLWIGTENAGLSFFESSTETFHHFTIKDGLPSSMVNSIVQGPQGNLWITTQAGIVRWHKKENRFTKIGSEPYLENNQYNPRAALLLRDGRILLGSTNGYSIVLPEQVKQNTTPPNVVFTEFTLSNQPVPIGEYDKRIILSGPLNDEGTVIKLSYLDKGIRFDFTSTDYSQPDKNQFAYRLMNFDTTWRYTGPGQRFATFSSLPGGRYELQVKAANSDGIWSMEPRILVIKVSPPFWTTWWFVLAAFIIGAVLLTGIIYFLLQRQRSHYLQHAMAAEQEILRLQNESLEKDISNKQAQLNASVLQSAHKNQFLEDLKSQIRKIEMADTNSKQKELHRLGRSIDSELTQKDYWDQFQLSFNQVHQDFVHKLHDRHPTISAYESRLCYFIRMGFSNAEMASILNVTLNGVEQSKYRLKKKLELDKEVSLNGYISEL